MKVKNTHMAIMRLSAMGDVAMIVPLVRAFRQQYPNVEITVVSRPFFKPFFETINGVQFFGVDLKERHKGVVGLWRLYRDLRNLGCNQFLDLHNVMRSQVVRSLFFMRGLPVAAMQKGRSEKRALTRLKNKEFKQLKPMIERHRDAFEKLGYSLDLSNPVFPPKVIVDDLPYVPNEKKGVWIGIAPFAQYESKVYPIELMQIVVGMLSNNWEHVTLFLFGGGDKEIAELEKIKEDRSNVVVIAGKIPFRDELKLISNLDVMLSMDSGNGHIAAMLGVEVVSVWGATHPYTGFVPFNQPMSNSITPDRTIYPLLPTSVYGNKKVDGYEDVMRSIRPAQIVEVVAKVIRDKKSH